MQLTVSMVTEKMASPRVSADLPRYDPTKSTLAYGDRALPKLVCQRGMLFADKAVWLCVCVRLQTVQPGRSRAIVNSVRLHTWLSTQICSVV